MAKKINKDDQIKETVEKLFKLLQVDGDVSIVAGDEGIDIVLETESNGIIIGRHGEVLEALQLILSLCIAKVTGEFQRVSLEVGDYKKNRTEYLTRLVEDTRNRVFEDKSEQALPNLKAWERRLVHMMLADDKDVFSESVGEGKERTLVVKPR